MQSDQQTTPLNFGPDAERHADSVKKYPFLNLSEGEYVVADVKRHPIGIFGIWFVDILIAILVIALAAVLGSQSSALASSGVSISPDIILAIMGLLTILILVFGWIGSIIYLDNHFYVTNESVVEKMRTGLFTARQQVISLAGVEDTSYAQNGILQYMLGYGSIRLSTVGNEQSYRFTIVDRPSAQLQRINDVVEDFKRRHVYENDVPQQQPVASSPQPTPTSAEQPAEKTTDQTS